jgi:hypothetical protein
MENETNEQRFSRMGVDRVRLSPSTDSLPQSMRTPAIQWLSQRDEEERLRRNSSQAEQIEIARSAKDAAWVAARAAGRAATEAQTANKRAIIAIIVAAISLAAVIVNISVVHWDATHPKPVTLQKP